MKYLEVEGARRPKAELRGDAVRQHIEVWPIFDLIRLISDHRCPMCFGAQVWGPITDDQSALELALSVGCCHWWLMRFFFFFRLGVWFQLLLYLINRMCILGFFFFFFFWESMDLLPSIICWVCIYNPWVCYYM